MVDLRDNLSLAIDAIRAHKLRASLTVLGLTMGVATLITVMTLVQGANTYVETKIANLGTNVFRVAKTPFAVVDFTVVVKALKNKRIQTDDLDAVRELCSFAKSSALPPAGRSPSSTRTNRWTTLRSSATRPTWSTSIREPSTWGPLLHGK